jgi:hypothetical protein
MSLKKSVGNIKKRDRSWESSENGKASARRWYAKSPHAMYSLYKKSSKKRGLEFSVEKQDFIQMLSQPCRYCGAEASENPSNRNGLDRVDNEIGYAVTNLVPCCFRCNQMKGKLCVEAFLSHIERIYAHAAQKK